MSRGPRGTVGATESTPGAVQLCADGELATRKAVTGVDTRLVQRFAAPPASPADWQLYADTVAWELTYYDPGRGKWLALHSASVTFSASGALAGGTPLDYGAAGACSADFGFPLPWDATLCAIMASKNDVTTTAELEIYAGGSMVTSIVIRDTDYSAVDGAANSDFAANDVVNVAVSGGTALAAAGSITLVFRRRIA